MLHHPKTDPARHAAEPRRFRPAGRSALRGIALLAALVLMTASVGMTTAHDGAKTDTDGDGFSDGIERWLGSDPASAASTPERRFIDGACSDGTDNDADGMVDADDPGCVKFSFFFPFFGTAKTDTDGDGFGDGIERWLGSDPASAASTPERRFIDGACSDGTDNDADGMVDADDPGCATFSFGSHWWGSRSGDQDSSDAKTEATSDAGSAPAPKTEDASNSWGDNSWGDNSWGDNSWGDNSWGDGSWGGDSGSSWGGWGS